MDPQARDYQIFYVKMHKRLPPAHLKLNTLPCYEEDAEEHIKVVRAYTLDEAVRQLVLQCDEECRKERKQTRCPEWKIRVTRARPYEPNTR